MDELSRWADVSEFTGERVIPELVDADLLNEHLARYRFANRVALGSGQPMCILDAGCGSGYGTAALTAATSVTAADISAEAVRFARDRYSRPGVVFLQASCDSLPLAAESFDMVVAFEVIEHLERWQDLLTESRRVLKPGGTLLVSTPNRDYYAESRGVSGPNPFHVHEFDYDEFVQALTEVFPHVRIWTQNHAGAIVFSPPHPEGETLAASGVPDPAGAHFYLAACSRHPIAANEIFAWLPSTANVLRERERHIAKLTGELKDKDAWLRQSLDSHSELLRRHEELTGELKRQNTWADGLNREIAARDARLIQLQNENEERLGWVQSIEGQLATAATEINRLREEAAGLTLEARGHIDRLEGHLAGTIARAEAEFSRLRAESAGLEEALARQTSHAAQLDGEIVRYRARLAHLEGSKWVRAGSKLGLGPRFRDGQ